jgi:arylformamidase
MGPKERENTGMDWIDISVPVRDNMVCWPGDPPVRIERVLDMAKGDSHNLTRLDMVVHSGTHMDAPRHFIRDGKGIDEIPLDIVTGKARVLDLTGREKIDVQDLAGLEIQPGERILFKTRNSEYALKSPHFIEDFVYLTKEGAKFLVNKRINLCGIDYLSIGGFRHDGNETHQILLKAGIWIIETLNLEAAEPGIYQLVCLPLKIAGCEGAPARAILRRI